MQSSLTSFGLYRSSQIETLLSFGYSTVAVVFDAPVSVCFARDTLRELRAAGCDTVFVSSTADQLKTFDVTVLKLLLMKYVYHVEMMVLCDM